MKIELSQNLVQAIVDYLSLQPFREVNQILNLIAVESQSKPKAEKKEKPKK